MEAIYYPYTLNFKRPGGTSRGVLHTKETWFLQLTDGNRKGIGECALFKGLSADDVPDYEEKLQWTCQHINRGQSWLLQELWDFPSIQFGVETAFRSLEGNTPFAIFPSSFNKGISTIPINGLIWMGDPGFMQEQIAGKLEEGFNCIKMKIGAIAFEQELALLEAIRVRYDASQVILRVDANGAFSPDEALHKLERLAQFDLHSIEQPIKAGQYDVMKSLCDKTPLAIALDEELIGVTTVTKKEELLQRIQPQYIILKPSLVGGFEGSEEWIAIADQLGIGWWITSALESNIGLNAIAQWTSTLDYTGHQGLGTGSLFTNNIEAPLEVTQGVLQYDINKNWNFNL